MAFGPIMRFTAGELQIELAPITKESVGEFVSYEHGGGIQQYTVSRYLNLSHAPVLEDEHEWFDKTRQDKTSLIWGIWVIEGDKRTLIGNSSLTNIGPDGSPLIQQAISGSMIFRKEYWGKGVASTAHKARTWYAFEHLGLHRLKSAVIQGNEGSCKALSRSGYFLTYVERNHHYVDGELRHQDCFECLNPLDAFWGQWWHGEEPTADALESRQITREAMDWAEQNVELP